MFNSSGLYWEKRWVAYKKDFPVEIVVNCGEKHNWEQRLQCHWRQKEKEKKIFRDL